MRMRKWRIGWRGLRTFFWGKENLAGREERKYFEMRNKDGNAKLASIHIFLSLSGMTQLSRFIPARNLRYFVAPYVHMCNIGSVNLEKKLYEVCTLSSLTISRIWNFKYTKLKKRYVRTIENKISSIIFIYTCAVQTTEIFNPVWKKQLPLFGKTSLVLLVRRPTLIWCFLRLSANRGNHSN